MLAWVFSFIIFVALPALCRAQSFENVSSANEKAFELKVKELMKTEFFEVVRGRAKPKPLRVNDAARIQELIKSKNVFLNSLNSSFNDSKNLIDETFSQFPSYVPADDARILKESFLRHAVSLILIEEKIKNAKSFFELYHVLQRPRDQFLILPLQVKLSYKLMADFDRLAGGGLSLNPSAYQSALQPFLSDFKSFIESSFSGEAFTDVDSSVSLWSSYFARLEAVWADEAEKIMAAAPAAVLPEHDAVTATFRAQDGLVIAYGSRAGIARVTEELKAGRYEGISAEEVENAIRAKNISGISKIETFYSHEKSELVFFQDTVRGAETGAGFPFLEGLELTQALRLLRLFGYESEMMEDCGVEKTADIKEHLKQKILTDGSSVVILCGTEPQSMVFSARK